MCTQAIELALEQANNASAETTIFLDDSTRNIVAGHQKGLTTVLVRPTSTACLHTHLSTCTVVCSVVCLTAPVLKSAYLVNFNKHRSGASEQGPSAAASFMLSQFVAPASIKLQALQGKAFTTGLGICMLLAGKVQSVAVLCVIPRQCERR